MRKNQRMFLGTLAVIMVAICGFTAMKLLYNNDNSATGPLLPRQETPEENPDTQVQPTKEKVYVNLFFIGQDENNYEVYKAVKREYDEAVDGSKIKFAIDSLIMGPKPEEKIRGVYSEIPSGTRVISVAERPEGVIINLSSAFEAGGGTDSIYKRIYQLIKTAKRNTDKPVYLYIEGRKADVIGGEGIMLNQPLNENSLDG